MSEFDKVIISEGQSLVDVALQTSGGIDALFALAQANGLSVTTLLVAGQQVEPVGYLNPVIARYYADRRYRVNNGIVSAGMALLPTPVLTDLDTNDWQTDDFERINFL